MLDIVASTTMALCLNPMPAIASQEIRLPYDIRPSSASIALPTVPVRASLDYFPNMCELNVWMLCDSLSKMPQSSGEVYAVIVSSPNKETIPLWHQKGGVPFMDGEGYRQWDFHIFTMIRKRSDDDDDTIGKAYYFLDLDSTIAQWPCPAETWVDAVLRPGVLDDDVADRHFRVVPAKEYLNNMHSSGSQSNLMESFVSMDPTKGYGRVLSETQFIREIV
jgi:hypothetical protein